MEDTGDDIPKLNNLTESSIYYVFRLAEQERLPDCLDFDVPTNPLDDLPCIIMKCVNTYCKSEDDEDDYNPFPKHCREEDFDKWSDALESLADLILWDRDFEADMELHMQYSDYYVPYREDPRFPSKDALEGCLRYLKRKNREVQQRLSASPMNLDEYFGSDESEEDDWENCDEDEDDEDECDMDDDECDDSEDVMDVA
jgi:hypothetical protein